MCTESVYVCVRQAVQAAQLERVAHLHLVFSQATWVLAVLYGRSVGAAESAKLSPFRQICIQRRLRLCETSIEATFEPAKSQDGQLGSF